MAKRREGASAEETLELKVDNMSFLLEQLGRDCAPDQLIRELTVNAIQAIQEAEGTGGRVVWDHEPTYTKKFGAYKLSIADTGIGMTGPEMVRYINHLAASGRIQSEQGNFGVGAKIAAATRNPTGMVYLSWRDGEGAMIWLWRNPETGRYGLKRLPRGDGDHGYWAPVSDDLKPESIDDHGTVVVLLGSEEGEETMGPPDGVADDGDPAVWLTRYLNTRFFEFPSGIEVHARERWGGPASRVRPVRGMREFLAGVAEASGRVDLGDATARWWVLPEPDEVSDRAAERHIAGGHVGALYQDELYELYTGRSGTAKLQSFGVAVGHQRIVLYIEPKTTGPRRVASNTARTALLMDGRPLPWGEWAESFREDLPQEILDLMEEVAGSRNARNHTESFKERMKGLAKLLFIGDDVDADLRRLLSQTAPRRDRERGESTAEELDGLTAPTEPDLPDDREPADAIDPGDAPEADRDSASDGDSPGRPDDPDVDLDRLLDLEVAWVSEEECGAYNRAGHYIPETNTLLMNRDFRAFREYVERWRDKYAGNPVAQGEVEDLVREWLEQPLREMIIRSHFLRGVEGWSDEDVDRLLSDEALTAVSLPCYLTEMRLRRAVSQRLGRLQPRSSAA